MFRNIRRTLATLFSVATLVAVPIATTSIASAAAAGTPNITDSLCSGVGNLNVDGTGTCSENTNDGTTKINNIITTIINVFSIVVGVVSVIMIILGGFRYITSGGESSNVTGAKNTIVYALIGLVVVALAQFIVKYVLAKVTSTGGGN